MGKNCNTCKWLEWVDGESESDTGFTCNKRHQQMWADGREQELLDNTWNGERRGETLAPPPRRRRGSAQPAVYVIK